MVVREVVEVIVFVEIGVGAEVEANFMEDVEMVVKVVAGVVVDRLIGVNVVDENVSRNSQLFPDANDRHEHI